MKTEQFLQSSLLFQGVSGEDLRLFLPICQQVSLERGKVIFQQGESARFLYIVGHGRVALTMMLERPDGSVTNPTTVASIGPGDAFGWSSIVEPHILTLSAQVVERADFIFFEGQALREMLGRHRDVGYLVMVNVAKLLAARLAQTREAFVYERGWVSREAH
jgi:CRP-like cAMP-binding protein